MARKGRDGKSNGKARPKRRTVGLELIPPPSGEFGRSEAVEWLRTDAAGYLSVAQEGYSDTRPEAVKSERWAYWSLLRDLAAMLGACVGVIDTGEAVQFKRSVDGENDIRDLFLLVTSTRGEIGPAEGGAWDKAVLDLEQELLKRAELGHADRKREGAADGA